MIAARDAQLERKVTATLVDLAVGLLGWAKKNTRPVPVQGNMMWVGIAAATPYSIMVTEGSFEALGLSKATIERAAAPVNPTDAGPVDGARRTMTLWPGSGRPS